MITHPYFQHVKYSRVHVPTLTFKFYIVYLSPLALPLQVTSSSGSAPKVNVVCSGLRPILRPSFADIHPVVFA